MKQDLTLAKSFYNKITDISQNSILNNDDLLMKRDGDIEVRYAPFDYIEKSARLVIVGITPGQSQANTALNTLARAKHNGKSYEDALRYAKIKASFSGSMRPSLIKMLDYIGIAELFNIPSTKALFEQNSTDIHFTSALRYPVFKNRKNYNGKPLNKKAPYLKQMVDTHLAEEAKILPNALWLTLGPRPIEAILHLIEQGLLDADKVLTGMPHPSGSNNERIAVFIGKKSPKDASKQTKALDLIAAANALKQKIKNFTLTA